MTSVAPVPTLSVANGDVSATSKVNAAFLDTDKGLLRTTLNTLLTALQTTIRDDNQLVDGIVRLRTFAAEVAMVIASQGWQPKLPCVAATTGANIVLTGEQVIDGVTTSLSRVLVKDQIDQTTNGIYITAPGAWARSADCNTASGLGYAAVMVTGGVTYASYSFVCQSASSLITLGVTALVFVAFSGAPPFRAASTASNAAQALTMTVGGANVIFCTGTGVAQDVTLPQASLVAQLSVSIVNSGQSIVTVHGTVVSANADAIYNSLTTLAGSRSVSALPGQSITLLSDGASWRVLSSTGNYCETAPSYGDVIRYGMSDLVLPVAEGGIGRAVFRANSPNDMASDSASANWAVRSTQIDFGTQTNGTALVAYGAGVFVAIGSINGLIATSPDGITWTRRSLGGSNTSNTGVWFLNGQFLLVSNGVFWTSPDGFIWTKSAVTIVSPVSVTYGGGQYVAVKSGITNAVATSPDGVTWTFRNASANVSWSRVIYNGAIYLATSTNGGATNAVMTSPDGITWTSRATPLSATLTDVVWNGTVFATCHLIGGLGMTSPDGITWTTRTHANANQWKAMSWNGTVFSCVAATGVGNRAQTSPDGINWTIGVSAADNVWAAIAWSGSIYVSVSTNGVGNRVMTSPDGSTWTTRSSYFEAAIRSVVCGYNGICVAVDPNGVIMLSSDGITWTHASSFPNGAFVWEAVTWGNGLFVAVSSSGPAGKRVATSPTGSIWTLQTTPADNQWRGIAFGNGVFVACANSGVGNRVMTSPDAVTWTLSTLAGLDFSWKSVVFGDDKFLMVADTTAVQGKTAYSTDNGITWNGSAGVLDNDWRSVTYGRGLFVAVGAFGVGQRVMTSPDAINWLSRTNPADNTWESVCYANGVFVAVSSTGTGNRVMVSSNGTSWALRASSADVTWKTVCYSPLTNGFIALADTGSANRCSTSINEGITTVPTGLADPGQNYIVAANAGSSTIPNRCLTTILDPVALIAGYTLTMPATPIHGQIVTICGGSFGITALTLSPNAGQTFATGAAITALAASAFAKYQYNQTLAKWFRFG